VANSSLARRELGFQARQGLAEIISSALKWEATLASFARRAVFLDRDGTINVDPGYLSAPAQLELLPGVAQAIGKLKRAGFLVFVVSNQSGVSRGKIKLESLSLIHSRMDELLVNAGGLALDRYTYCTHLPEANCECRKPKAKLLWDLAQEFGVDLGGSFMVGDKASDLEVGREAGCLASVLVRTGYGMETEKTHAAMADFTASGLESAADWILARS
jgi:histidinol-phosphate phosphatase family protein